MQQYIQKYSDKYNIPPALIRAIIMAESGGNPYAIRYEDHYKWTYNPGRLADLLGVSEETEIIAQKTSWGLMQIMGAVARELEFRKSFLSKLCEPRYGIKYGCQHLANYYEKHQNWKDAISAYNQGSPKKDKSGNYKNQQYVDKVVRLWKGAG